MTNTWKPIAGFNDYEVSDLGQIRRVATTGGRAGTIMSIRPNTTHPTVSLSRGGAQHDRRVDTLLLETFRGPCPTGHRMLCHDGDPGNTALDNLDWTPWESMQGEEWRSVDRYTGLYEVSDLGRVRSMKTWGRWPSGRIIGRAMGGYRRVTLHDGARKSERLVHHLVLEAFVGPCPEGMEASHRNDVSDDNRLENLLWETHRENIARRTLNGRDTVGERHGNAKLTDSAVVEIRRLLRETLFRADEIGSRFGVTRTTVSVINHGKGWRHVPDDHGDAGVTPLRRQGRMRDGNRHSAKLSPVDVLDIRQLLRATTLQQGEIATLYGVSLSAIVVINSGKTWRSLPDSKHIPGANTFPCRPKIRGPVEART